jgi:hypothetical protein
MTEPDNKQDNQFGLSATLVSTAMAGVSLTLILLTFDTTKRLNFYSLPGMLLGDVFYFWTICLLLASPILLIFMIKPLPVSKNRPYFLILFLLVLALALPTFIVSIDNHDLHYECAPIFTLALLAIAKLNIAEVLMRRLTAYYSTCWMTLLVSLTYWLVTLLVLSAA